LEAEHAGLPEILKILAGEKSKAMYETGDLDAGVISCGQGVCIADDIPTLKELFDRIMG
jgi:nitronate monooxygenase